VLLTAAALATRKIRLGPMVTPVARRRVSKLAREVTTLDRLTRGRMVLGVGLGSPVEDEFGSFGETTDTSELAARLDEGLAALNLLWSGEPVTFRGDYVVVGSLEQAGATWWAECEWDDLESADPMLRRADQGPPRL
jgi:alkanesulfonate monooxygenase SsuD/methylene tetrahydromethanopterin reductase-like flavin-dependent oxidoreductase (luciferase family)